MSQFSIPKKWMTAIGSVSFGLIILTFAIYAVTSSFSIFVKIPLAIGVVGVMVFWISSAMVSRTARYGSNVAVMIFLAFVILVLVNFISDRHYKRIDTTTSKQFSLSEQTKKILDSLDRQVKVTAFYTEDHYRRGLAHDILNEYAAQSSKISVTFIDPNAKPGEAMAYGIKQNGTVVFESEGKREDVESYQNEEQCHCQAYILIRSI